MKKIKYLLLVILVFLFVYPTQSECMTHQEYRKECPLAQEWILVLPENASDIFLHVLKEDTEDRSKGDPKNSGTAYVYVLWATEDCSSEDQLFFASNALFPIKIDIWFSDEDEIGLVEKYRYHSFPRSKK